MEKKIYLEIVKYEGDEVVKRLDVSHHSEHNKERIERGMNINLNHEGYYTRETESETELQTL